MHEGAAALAQGNSEQQSQRSQDQPNAASTSVVTSRPKAAERLACARISWLSTAAPLGLLRSGIGVIGSEKMQRDHERDGQHGKQSELNHCVVKNHVIFAGTLRRLG